MTKRLIIAFVVITVIGTIALMAGSGFNKTARNNISSTQQGTCPFIDEDGDGINDNLRDHDGDGIPNYLDPDWVRPQDGSGQGNGQMNGNRNNINANMRENRRGQGGSFQNFNKFNSNFNFGTGICDESGNGSGRGRRGGR